MACSILVKSRNKDVPPPNTLCLWVDSYLQNQYCSALVQRKNLSLFRFTPTLRNRELGSMEKTGSISNNSMKMEFFIHKDDRQNFMFATCCPVSFLTDKRAYLLGCWNANNSACDEKLLPIPDVLVCLYGNVTTIGKELPPALEWNPHQHMEDLRTLSDWLQKQIKSSIPKTNTSFSNMRTFCRGYGVQALFQDIHSIFIAEEGTTLPPVLACYALSNALICHNITPIALSHHILRLLHGDRNSVQVVMNVTRDVLACWTQCSVEGKYMPDECLGQEVEDQPFSFASSPFSQRVFERDDCEGRNQQASYMALLLRQMAAFVEAKSTEALQKLVCEQARKACFHTDVTTETLHLYTQLCVELGELFRAEIMTVHMSVGEASFAQFTQSAQACENVVGHSYATLLYNDPEHSIYDFHIVEVTGWENESTKPEKPTEEQIAILKSAITSANATACCVLAPSMENKIYLRTFVINGWVLFGTSGKSTGLPGKDNNWSFGATTEELKHRIVFYNPSVPLPSGSGGAIAVRTADLIAMFKDSKAQQERYRRILCAYPHMARCARPPPKTEAALLQIMQNRWGKISQNHIEACNNDSIDRPLTFSVPQDNIYKLQEKLPQSMRGCKVLTHPFMRSCIVRVFK